jgi:outer membrane receptor protein involved in Fe transport
MCNRIPALFVFVFFSLQLFSQEKGASVTGTVTDNISKQPIEFATVQLLNADSVVVAATITDKKGKFTLPGLKPASYTLRASFIGYERSYKTISFEANAMRVNMGVIEIHSATMNMNEVTVTATKSMLNTSIDRKVYDVTRDIMAQSGNASDLLKNIPSVEVDIEGQVSLRGSPDVIILINGRPSPLMGKTKAEALQQLPANSIERIEVITNPSARYKPDGTSGIINIVLKKNTKAGWNGSVIANAGNKNRYNANISFNYKPGKLNLFTTYSIRKDNRIRLNNIDRTYFDSLQNISGYYTQNSHSHSLPLAHVLTIGADYTISEQNTIGISGNYVNRHFTRRDVVNNITYNATKNIIGNYDRLRYDPEYEVEKNVTAYWQHGFSKEDHELRIECNASAGDEQEDNHYTNVYHLPSIGSLFDNTLIKTTDNQQELTIDYTDPLSADSKLEAGYDGSFTQQDMNFRVDSFNLSMNKFENDLTRSNRFLYNESIHAFYSTYQHSYEKFGYAAGLRVEAASIKGNLVTKDSLVSNDYFKIYPTVHLSYKLNNGELQLNYSKRVHRAEGDDINPFPEYQDPRNLRAGNPNLKPEIIHSFEFGYKWQNKNFSFVPGLYYRYKLNGFTSVILPLDDSTLLTTQENLSNDKSAGLEVIFSAKAGSFFSANLSSNFFYNQIDASDLGYSNKKSILSMSSNLNATFTLSKTTMMQVSSNYRSPRLTPQGKTVGSFVCNTGIRQDLFKKKVSVILTVSDLFRTLKQKTVLDTSFLGQTSTGRRDAQIIYLGLSWRFGKMIKKTDDKLQFDNNF